MQAALLLPQVRTQAKLEAMQIKVKEQLQASKKAQGRGSPEALRVFAQVGAG